MDRGRGTGGMRDYVDPWAHNMNGGNNNQMGGGNFGGMGNGNMSTLNSLNGIGGLGNNSGPGNQNSGAFGVNNMDMDGKTSTQVTIPKDVRSLRIFSFFFFN